MSSVTCHSSDNLALLPCHIGGWNKQRKRYTDRYIMHKYITVSNIHIKFKIIEVRTQRIVKVHKTSLLQYRSRKVGHLKE
jgi:hypothetical protein